MSGFEPVTMRKQIGVMTTDQSAAAPSLRDQYWLPSQFETRFFSESFQGKSERKSLERKNCVRSYSVRAKQLSDLEK